MKLHTRIITEKYGFYIHETQNKYENDRINQRNTYIHIVNTPSGEKYDIDKHTNKSCLDFTIIRDDIQNTVNAKLNYLEYYTTCSIEKNLEKGHGTINMICAFIHYLRETHPDVKSFTLDDLSQIVCNGKQVSLKYYYFVLYNKTWYEKVFNAYPICPDEFYRDMKHNIHTSQFTLDYISNYWMDLGDELKTKLRKMYIECNENFQTFIRKIKKKSPDKRCYLLSFWIERFIMESIDVLPLTWNVIVDNVDCKEHIVKRIQSVIGTHKTQKYTSLKGGNIGNRRKTKKRIYRKKNRNVMLIKYF